MPGVRIGVHPASIRGRAIDGLFDLIRYADAPQRHVATGNALGKLHDVGLDTPVFQPEPGASAPKPGDDLVANEQHVIFVADLPDARKVVVLRHNDAPSPLHGFGDKGPYRVRPFAQNRLFEQVRGSYALASARLTAREAVRIR